MGVGGSCSPENDPWVGEKGMLTEGGIRVPFIMHWPGVLPVGKIYDAPVISLDVAATALALAGEASVPGMDGVNLIPYLTGSRTGVPHAVLYWRFWNQAALRRGVNRRLDVRVVDSRPAVVVTIQKSRAPKNPMRSSQNANPATRKRKPSARLRPLPSPRPVMKRWRSACRSGRRPSAGS